MPPKSKLQERVGAIEAAGRRHDHLHGHVAPRRGTRRDQSFAGLSGFLAAGATRRTRRVAHARRAQPVRAHGRPAGAARCDRGTGPASPGPPRRRRDARSPSRRAGPRRSSARCKPSSIAATRSSCSIPHTTPTSRPCGSRAGSRYTCRSARPRFDVDWDRVRDAFTPRTRLHDRQHAAQPERGGVRALGPRHAGRVAARHPRPGAVGRGLRAHGVRRPAPPWNPRRTRSSLRAAWWFPRSARPTTRPGGRWATASPRRT